MPSGQKKTANVGGRPTKYSATVQKKADFYCDNYQDYNHPIPMAAGLARVLKVARSSLYVWAEKHEEFSDTLERINTYQEVDLICGGLRGELNPTITKMMLAGFGYSDKPKDEDSGEAQPMIFNFTVNPAVDEIKVTNAS